MKKTFSHLLKISLVIIAFNGFVSTLNAQDKIYKTDNSIIDSRVTEISETEVKYKSFNNQSGPELKISIADIHMIVYENGYKEVYNPLKSNTTISNSSGNYTNISNTTNSATNTDKLSGIFFALGFGPAFSLAPQLLENNTEYDTITFTNKAVVGSYGKGLNLKLGLGYLFNKNIGLALNYNMIKGAKFSNTSTNNSYSPSSTITQTRSVNTININPEFLINAGSAPFNPYAKFGVLIGISPKLIHEYSDPSKAIEKKSILTGGMPLGYSASLGMAYSVKKINLFAELAMNAMSWAPKKAELIKFTKDGQDQLPSLTEAQIETEFVDSITLNNPSETSGNQKLLKYYPLNSFGVNFGIRIHL